MRYIEVRNQIETGDLLAFSGNAIYSNIIKKWAGFQSWLWEGKWINDILTHVGFAVWIILPPPNNARLCILESHVQKGVRLNPLSAVLQDGYWSQGGQAYWQPLIKLDGYQVVNEALKYWTKGYAPLKQFLVAGLRITRWMRHRLHLPIDVGLDQYHCSELVTKSLIDADFEYDGEPSITRPQEVSAFNCFGARILLEP